MYLRDAGDARLIGPLSEQKLEDALVMQCCRNACGR
jgi:hypothetical protein